MNWRSLQAFLLTLVVIATQSMFIAPVQASILTSATLQLSTHAISTIADHTFAFVTPSGVESSTDTLIVDYATGFSLGSVAFGDIDLAVDDDGACDGPWGDKTLASSAGAGTWGASVAGQIITFTAPTDAALGEITAGRCVQIQVGTHASGGVNQVTNPGSAASYEVDVYGTFGDHALYAVGITGTSGLPVTAVVSSGGGPSLPPPVGDTTGPVISNVLVSNITTTSATVTWLTDEAASRVLSYGTTPSYALGNLTDGAFRTVHTQSLSGLQENTGYHFRILATDNSGNATTSGDYTFSTLDLTPPVVTVSVINITETTADIVWTTDEATTGVVTVTDAGTYPDASLSTAHTVSLTGLTSATTYNVQVAAQDASNNTTVKNTSFTTLTDLPPSNVMNFTATAGDTVVTLAWTSPTDADFAGVILVYRTDRFPTDPADGTSIYTGFNTSFLHTGLTNGQKYFYTIFATDAARMLSSGATASATPFTTATPIDTTLPPGDTTLPVGDTTLPPGDTTLPPGDTTPVTPPVVIVPGDTTPPSVPVITPEPDLPEPEPSVLIPVSEVTFMVARDAIMLRPSNDLLHVLGGRPLAISLNVANAPSTITSVDLTASNGSFLMNPATLLVSRFDTSLVAVENESLYVARVVTPLESGPLTIAIHYVTGETQVLTYQLNVRANGSVIADTSKEYLSDVAVSLYERLGNWQLWNAVEYAQENPLQVDGNYAWYVPNGTYRVRALKEGYSSVDTVALQIEDNIINVPIVLIELLPPVDTMIQNGASPLSATVQQLNQSIRILRQNPGVISVSRYATPVVAVSAASTVGIVLAAFNGLPFLQYLFTAPFLLFKRRRRKQWGVVYDSLRKIPVDLAIVRLLDGQSKRVLKSQVTDRQGRYLFIVKPGVYLLQVSKEGFTYPTVILADLKRDGEYLDLYHGEPISVTEADAVVAANIPLDPAGEGVKTPAKIKLDRLARRVMYALSLIGLVVALIVAFLHPTTWTVAVALIQALSFVLFVRMAIPARPKSWGIVYDRQTRRPLIDTVVRIFDPTYNKLLETQLTDSRGRYAFLVGPNEYYTTYEKDSYTKLEVRPIDRTDTKEASYVSVDVGLTKNTPS
ncbi:hypothetical protein COV06_02130 [Candidatus Uhrbacteria bacterium CG10_big_fil_rev_8_21_14_0_10_50_16]|uniref:Fibronectin type-III domain-containing protein n=1 Tax=Candidatus Uhrbacteria bacterium CG10_big_fil_rev_8_21_14_0_10_50_16 TaxID=1975039 RepID=A0A2H0RMS5_9BACT|nr:MAG: hypothetical protein COV06_02130 [Candidatus Uhrbacteria bacterium CG10_big_fil_rev_8_21_14_0_10_50_16]